MLDWLFGSSMVWVLLCCGDNAVPIAKYKNNNDCVNAQLSIISDSRHARGNFDEEKVSYTFSSCIPVEKLISR